MPTIFAVCVPLYPAPSITLIAALPSRSDTDVVTTL
jgi:hypothetical protein